MEPKSDHCGQCRSSVVDGLLIQLVLPYSIRSNLIQYMHDVLPYEGGGVLLGTVQHGSTLVDATFCAHRFFALPNTVQSPTRFLADPKRTVAAVIAACYGGETIIATVHSHPDANAIPSYRDLEEAFDYAIPHLILGQVTSSTTMKAFLYTKNPLGFSFHTVPLVFSNPIRY